MEVPLVCRVLSTSSLIDCKQLCEVRFCLDVGRDFFNRFMATTSTTWHLRFGKNCLALLADKET